MRKIREVLRLRFELSCTHRQIAAACSVSPATVGDYLGRAMRAGLGWEQAQSLSEAEVEAKLFTYIGRSEPEVRSAIDFDWVHRELRRHGVTLQLLWGDYQLATQKAAVRPYQYSQFCELYAAWRGQQRLSMRQTHRPGEKLFVDYSGKRPCVTDPVTGEQREVELYVAVLGASNYTFVEVTFSQSIPDFTASTVRALEYFGASPKIVVPDQLRSAVARPDRYDPDINQTFHDLAQHYEMVVIPAPPRKPKGKAKVEVGVLIAQRWILARLRNRTFFSLAELNNAVAELVEELNERPFQKLEGNRRKAFETIDRPAMRALPTLRFEVAERKTARANIDYHIEFDDRYYSVPNQLRQQRFDVRATASIIELWLRGVRIVSHRRSYARKGFCVTLPEHRPKSHEDYGEWPPERLLGWAATFGAHVEEVVRRTMAQYPQPEMGYRPVLGIIRCAQKHGAERMDAACLRALSVAGQSAPHRKYIEGIIKRGLDHAMPQTPPVTPRSAAHEHVRGPSYFDKRKTVTLDETINKLTQMKLHTLAKALREMLELPPDRQLAFEDQLGLLVDQEWAERENRKVARRIQEARLSTRAAPEEILCDAARGLERSLLRDLTSCQWVKSHHNLVILGATGVGKSFLASALAQAACRQGFRALFVRVSRLLEQLAIARAAADYSATLARIAKIDVLVLDDFLLAPMTDLERRDLLEVLEDRYGKTSTVITSQLPTKSWHEALGDPTIADAICDRLVHNAHVLPLRGSSLRRQKGLKPQPDPQPAA